MQKMLMKEDVFRKFLNLSLVLGLRIKNILYEDWSGARIWTTGTIELIFVLGELCLLRGMQYIEVVLILTLRNSGEKIWYSCVSHKHVAPGSNPGSANLDIITKKGVASVTPFFIWRNYFFLPPHHFFPHHMCILD